MIYTITDPADPYLTYIKDDPVRPHIPLNERVNRRSQIFVLVDQDKVNAVVCAKFCKGIPASEHELLENASDDPDTIVFYTIWSYAPGAGRQLIVEGLEKVKTNLPNIKKFVTLSPTTEMARKFHLKNGASVYRVNSDSINYEYL